MEGSRRLKLVIIPLGVGLLFALAAFAWALWQNYWWRESMNHMADQAGAAQAMSSFRRGRLVLWEISPTNDHPRFSGRKEGVFEIWLEGHQAGMPGPWQYAERRKVEAHNRQMRYMYEHPERFTLGQDERK